MRPLSAEEVAPDAATRPEAFRSSTSESPGRPHRRTTRTSSGNRADNPSSFVPAGRGAQSTVTRQPASGRYRANLKARRPPAWAIGGKADER